VGNREHRRARDSVVTIATVLGVVAAMGFTLFGLGAAEHAVAGYDASSWLWSSPKGEVARVNGATGRVDTRFHVPGSDGHVVQVSQTDRYLVLRDQSTGLVSAIDLASLQVAASAPTTAGLGITIAMHEDAVFIVDSVQGAVRQLDPLSLVPVGEPMRFPPGIAGGTFDGNGLLWIAVPSEGTVVAVRPALSPRANQSAAAKGRAGPGGGQGGSVDRTPREARTVPVADPDHELVVAALDDGVAVLDRTTSALTTLRGERTRTVALELAGPGAMPARIAGADVPVTIVDDRHVYVVNNDKIYDFAVPGTGPRLKPCVAWSGRFYCADDATGTVYALNQTGQLIGTLTVRDAGGPLELEVRERHLFINAPDSSTAQVVDEEHRVRVVDKYARNILGAEPPPKQPPAAPPKPVVGKPGPPRSVTASAGNASARVAWGPANPNGAPILRYVIEGGPKPVTVSAKQRSLEITGLVNGQTYRFSVHAVNAKGAGAKRNSNPIVPTSDVPDPPTAVTAKENPNGTVTLTWPAANGQGRKIVRYAVTAIGVGKTEEIGAAPGPTLTTEAGALEYGTQYAFTVVSINDKGASSVASPVSNSVVPFTKPGAVKNLAAATVADQKGAIRATWRAADENGRPITRYVVSAGGRDQPVTGTAVALTGFGDGEDVTVSVKAVNLAGEGAADTATARTIAPPTLTLTGKSGGYNSISVSLGINDNGSPTSCTISVNNSPAGAINCSGGTVGGLWPGNTYSFTVSATNAAGAARPASDSVGTPALFGSVICGDQNECGLNSQGGGIWVYTTPSQNGRAVDDTSSPSRYQATCWANGDAVINAEPWGGRQDRRWIRIKFEGDNYIPFAWFRLDDGDNPGMLPGC
jgi:hypothetical protein